MLVENSNSDSNDGVVRRRDTIPDHSLAKHSMGDSDRDILDRLALLSLRDPHSRRRDGSDREILLPGLAEIEAQHGRQYIDRLMRDDNL